MKRRETQDEKLNTFGRCVRFAWPKASDTISPSYYFPDSHSHSPSASFAIFVSIVVVVVVTVFSSLKTFYSCKREREANAINATAIAIVCFFFITTDIVSVCSSPSFCFWCLFAILIVVIVDECSTYKCVLCLHVWKWVFCIFLVRNGLCLAIANGTHVCAKFHICGCSVVHLFFTLLCATFAWSNIVCIWSWIILAMMLAAATVTAATLRSFCAEKLANRRFAMGWQEMVFYPSGYELKPCIDLIHNTRGSRITNACV